MDHDIGSQPWPSEGLEQVEACPACGCKQRVTVHRHLTDTIFFCARGSWELHRCDRCGSCYVDPRPSPEKIHLAYARYFTHEEPGVSLNQMPTGLKRLRRSLANGYRNWRYGTRELPATALGIWAIRALPRARRLVDSSMRFIPRACSGRRLLDVGAGNGAYLLSVRSAGWEIVGVEPDPAAAAVARRTGLDVREGSIHSLQSGDGTFDVITMNHVIEHVHEPRKVLSEAFRLLRPGGILYLETPNIESYGHRRFGRHWRGLEPPRHLVLFNWNSLEALLSEVGFAQIERRRRSGVYVSLAAKSRAIQRGGDPETTDNSRLLTRVADSLLELRTLFDHRRSEYVTLLAQKR